MRIVSLCPSLTDTVFALGKGAELIGRTKFCVQPKGAIDTIARVGGTKDPKLQQIVELRPDLVLLNEEENRKEDADALVAAGIRVLATFARDVSGAAQAVVVIGRAIGAAQCAAVIAASIEAIAAEVATRVMQRHRFVYVIWNEPLMAAGKDTYISELLRVAGGDNVAFGDERYPVIDATTLQRADRIFLSSEPFPFTEKHRDELAARTQVPASRFELVDGERLSWHGAKTPAGLRYAEQLFSNALTSP